MESVSILLYSPGGMSTSFEILLAMAKSVKDEQQEHAPRLELEHKLASSFLGAGTAAGQHLISCRDGR